MTEERQRSVSSTHTKTPQLNLASRGRIRPAAPRSKSENSHLHQLRAHVQSKDWTYSLKRPGLYVCGVHLCCYGVRTRHSGSPTWSDSSENHNTGFQGSWSVEAFLKDHFWKFAKIGFLRLMSSARIARETSNSMVWSVLWLLRIVDGRWEKFISSPRRSVQWGWNLSVKAIKA